MTRPAPLTVDRVIENHRDGSSTHQVQITLSDAEHRQLVGDIARRIYQLSVRGQASGVRHLLLGAGRPERDLHQSDALTRLMRVLSMPAPSVLLDAAGDEAAAFATAVEAALEEPASCHCGLAIEDPNPLVTDCGACADARPLRVIGA